MPTEVTKLRRVAKEQWLRDHPSHHAWLRQRLPGTWSLWCKDPMTAAIVKSLKDCSLYAASTVAADICSTMRRLALALPVGSLGPNEKATADIEIILVREGVDRAKIIRKLRR